MSLSNDDIKIVIFSISSVEREYLRNCLIGVPATVLCFEKESIIFDNYMSILPKIVIARTDSWAVAWRFVFALHALEADSTLFIASDALSSNRFHIKGLSILVRCIPAKFDRAGLNQVTRWLSQDLPGKKENEDRPFLVGEARGIKKIRSMLPYLASTPDPVLITGEGGTGKELLARLMVTNNKDTFVKLNCAELVPEMVARFRMTESFHADSQNPSVNKGTLGTFPLVFLLDKINLLHPRTQSEILLLLDGTSKYGPDCLAMENSHIRFIATCEDNLEQLVRHGKFRKDLYFRLNVIPIYMPPLRDRKQDISLLIDYFIIEACANTQKRYIVPTDHARESLCAYEWPGNLDELKTLMYRMAVSGDESFIYTHYCIPNGKKKIQDKFWQLSGAGILPDSLEIQNYLPALNNFSLKNICNKFVSRTEKKLMQKALESTNWNRKKAAALLNISYKSMLNKIKAYDI